MSLEEQKIKAIKKLFKKDKLLKKYKNIFVNKNIKFFLTKISIIFSSNIEINNLYKFEKELFENCYDIDTWAQSFYECSYFFMEEFRKCDWESFGKFMYYYFNQCLFLNNDTKTESIYTQENFNELNNKKSKWYNTWMTSMYETYNKDFNIYVRKVINIL